jgi:filamentous hemagglutinin family protein
VTVQVLRGGKLNFSYKLASIIKNGLSLISSRVNEKTLSNLSGMITADKDNAKVIYLRLSRNNTIID